MKLLLGFGKDSHIKRKVSRAIPEKQRGKPGPQLYTQLKKKLILAHSRTILGLFWGLNNSS